MNAKKLLVIVVCLCVVVVSPSMIFPSSEIGHRTLCGLEGVNVLIENIAPDAEGDGLHRSTLQVDVELRLRKAGIRVLTEEEMLNLPNMPHLYVNIQVMKRKNGGYIYSIAVSLSEWVKLIREPFSHMSATTWKATGCIGIVGVSYLEEDIRRQVGDMVDEFINDYLAANLPSKPVNPRPIKKE